MIPSYNDLCREIEVLEIRKNDLLEEQNGILKKMHKGCPRDIKAQSYNNEIRGCSDDSSLDKLAIELDRVVNKLLEVNGKLDIKYKSKKEMESIIGKVDSIECKIFYCRTILHMTQEETAEELNKSPRQVQRIEKNIKNVVS